MDECCCDLNCELHISSMLSYRAQSGFSPQFWAPASCALFRVVTLTLRRNPDEALIWQTRTSFTFPGNLQETITLDDDGGAAGVPIGFIPPPGGGLLLSTAASARFQTGGANGTAYLLDVELSEPITAQEIEDGLAALIPTLAEMQALDPDTYWVRTHSGDGSILTNQRGFNDWYFDMVTNGFWVDCFNPQGGLTWRVISQRAKRTRAELFQGHVRVLQYDFWEIYSYVEVNANACIIRAALDNAAINPTCGAFAPVCAPGVAYAGAIGEFLAVPQAGYGTQAMRCGVCPV